MRTFRRRLSQCVTTLRTASNKMELILFIDAIDNAAQHANDRKEQSFPTILLKSFYYGGPIPGVRLVVTCRSHRIDISTNDVPYIDFKLEPFTLSEMGSYLRDRLPNVTQTEIQVAQARSGGNPRILEHLVNSDSIVVAERYIYKIICIILMRCLNTARQYKQTYEINSKVSNDPGQSFMFANCTGDTARTVLLINSFNNIYFFVCHFDRTSFI